MKRYSQRQIDDLAAKLYAGLIATHSLKNAVRIIYAAKQLLKAEKERRNGKT